MSLNHISQNLRYVAGFKKVLSQSSINTLKPPSYQETQRLISYLHLQEPVIVGSTALTAHIGTPFRTTKDLDVVVTAIPRQPPPGWQVDKAAVGVTSWISPTGGSVDLLLPGQDLPDGRSIPQSVLQTDKSTTLPIANRETLFKMKLSSFREGDMRDLLELAKSVGIPPLTDLDEQQQENLQYLKILLDQVQ